MFLFAESKFGRKGGHCIKGAACRGKRWEFQDWGTKFVPESSRSRAESWFQQSKEDAKQQPWARTSDQGQRGQYQFLVSHEMLVPDFIGTWLSGSSTAHYDSIQSLKFFYSPFFANDKTKKKAKFSSLSSPRGHFDSI